MKVSLKSQINMIELLDNQVGFITNKMSTDELLLIKNIIEEQYYTRVLSVYPECSSDVFSVPMSHYHIKSDLLNHKKLWPKKARILGPNAANTITSLPFFKKLVGELNIKDITSEDGSGWPEIYWRIVRPGSSDIGDYHADKWFWDLGHGEIPPGLKRLKIWIAIEVESGKSGLCVIPGSHLKNDWKYHGRVDQTGIAKPQFDEDISQLTIYNVPTEPGDFIVFHDGLIHRGMENKSDKTRVSMEATLLVPDVT